jgi:proline iminopeptidase
MIQAYAELRRKAQITGATLWRKLSARLLYRSLYPNIEPYDRGTLEVSTPHKIYYEQSGNPHGKPVVFLHGGPGGGTTPAMRRFFNPSRYRIILFDQRGSGRSRPLGCLEDNTTWHLVEDIESLRRHLGIQTWMVFGGSWGATLGLAYAQRYPECVTEIVLRGVFMMSRPELQWFYQQGGASKIFPDAWKDYQEVIPHDERGDMIHAYYRRLMNDDKAVQLKVARAWSAWEARTSNLILDPGLVNAFASEKFALALARIECHYFINGGFLESDTQLLEGIDAIRSIPATIVQGRYDIICPVEAAWRLHNAWPEARLIIVPDAGHSAFEPGNRHHLLNATDKFSAP